MSQQGDAAAEEFLIRQYKTIVNKVTKPYFIIGADREDVLQEAMIGLFKAIKEYRQDSEGNFKTYATLCMNRQVISAIKAANRDKHAPLNTSVSLNKNLNETLESDGGDDPETALLLNDIMHRIFDDEKGLFSAFEKKVWKEYTDGKTYSEMAEIFDKNPKAIYNAMERIKKKIIKYIQD